MREERRRRARGLAPAPDPHKEADKADPFPDDFDQTPRRGRSPKRVTRL